MKDEILYSDELNFIKFLVFMHVEITCYRIKIMNKI